MWMTHKMDLKQTQEVKNSCNESGNEEFDTVDIETCEEQEPMESVLGPIVQIYTDVNEEDCPVEEEWSPDQLVVKEEVEIGNGISTLEDNEDLNTTDKETEHNEEGIKITSDTILELHNVELTLPVHCDFCPKKFRNLDKFDAHMANHLESRFFSCQLCNNTYISWSNLVAHRKACHRSEVISCASCGQRKHHLGLVPVNFPVGDFPIGCEECLEGFNSVIQLYRHYRMRGKHSRKKKVTWEAVDSNTEFSDVDEHSDSTPRNVKPVIMAYACPVCNTQFFSEIQLKAHMQKLDDDKNCFPCNVCTIRFCNARSLASHKRCHPETSARSYLCSYCGKVLRDRGSYHRHKFIHTGEKPYQCDWCNKCFSRRSALKSHKYSHPLKEDYNCFNCKQSYQEFSDLRTHVEEVHYRQKGKKLTCEICQIDWPIKEFLSHYADCHIAKEDESTKLRQATVTCHVCNKIFSQPTALSRHLKLHNPTVKQSYMCEVCGETIARRYELLMHMRSHYNTDEELPDKYQKMLQAFQQSRKQKEAAAQMSFICEYCGREFNKKINLQLHVRRHTGEKPHACHLCQKAFYTRQQLSIHVRQHTGERPYVCKVCSKTFTSPTALYMHRKLHNKVKQYKCSHCNKEFFWHSAYISHVRLHTGERPYQCTLCPKSFTLKGKLNLHMKKHELDQVIHTCSDCGQNFGTPEELNTHREDHCYSTMVTLLHGEANGETEYIILDETVCPDGEIYMVDENMSELVVSNAKPL